MEKIITVPYPVDAPVLFQVYYQVNYIDENVREITCSVDNPGAPVWLQVKKFSFMSRRTNGQYVLLFNEVNNSRNLVTTLFIDLVYSSIIEKEKLNPIEAW